MADAGKSFRNGDLPSKIDTEFSKSMGELLLTGAALTVSGSSCGHASSNWSGSCATHAQHLPVAGAELLYSRIARVEEQLAAEQRLRNETEARLTNHLNILVGVSVSEQLDLLRRQLMEERQQRQVDIAAARASIEANRCAVTDAEFSLKLQVADALASTRSTLRQEAQQSALDVTVGLDSITRYISDRSDMEVSRDCDIRLTSLETTFSHINSEVCLQAKSLRQVHEKQQALAEVLELRIKALIAKLDVHTDGLRLKPLNGNELSRACSRKDLTLAPVGGKEDVRNLLSQKSSSQVCLSEVSELHALRERNLCLREVNMQMREREMSDCVERSNHHLAEPSESRQPLLMPPPPARAVIPTPRCISPGPTKGRPLLEVSPPFRFRELPGRQPLFCSSQASASCPVAGSFISGVVWSDSSTTSRKGPPSSTPGQVAVSPFWRK